MMAVTLKTINTDRILRRMAGVCAVTINYNNARDTARCVASLCASSASADVFVVDNSPNDPQLDPKLTPYSGVTTIYPETNIGFGAGNNLGVAQALNVSSYDYILLLNNDATIGSEDIEQLLDAADKHPAAGIIAPRIVLDENQDVLWYGGGEVDWFRAAAVVPGFFGPADSELAKKSRWVTFASGCAMLFRRSVWEELNGFDPRFFMYEEDLEICLRAIESGWKIWYESGALVKHRGQGSFRVGGSEFQTRLDYENESLPFFAYHIFRNRVLNVRLHAKGYCYLCAMVGLPLFFVKKGLLFAIHRRFRAIQSMIKGVVAGILT